jgi:outer membrane protein assembly factor BamB
MRAVFLSLMLSTLAPGAAGAVEFEQLTGWWHSPVEHAGEPSEVYLHLILEDGKQVARFSMVAMDAWDVPIGTVTVDGDSLDMTPYPFPLAYDAEDDTLSGQLPEAAVPVYAIPVRFERVDAPQIPEPRRFDVRAPESVWQYATGAPVWAGLALDSSQHLLVANESGLVTALDRSSGRPVWQHSVEAPVRARPTVVGRHAYLVADDGSLSKLDTRKGRPVWRVQFDAGGPPRLPIDQEDTQYDRYASAVTENDGTLYVGGRDGALHALDAKTGHERWRFATQDIITSAPAVDRDTVIVASFDNHIYGVDAKTGQPRWQRDLKGAIPGDVVVADGLALAGSRSYDLYALDVATGEPRWQYYYWFSWIESPPRVVDDTAYVGSSDALSLFAFDVRTGKLRWQRKVPGWAWPQPAVEGDVVYVATIGIGPATSRRQGTVTAIDRTDGDILWVYRGNPIEGAPQWGFAAAAVADDEFVYAADLEGTVTALKR